MITEFHSTTLVCHPGALDTALRAAGLAPNFIGVSFGGLGDVRLHFEDAVTDQQKSNVLALVSNHDPVFLIADKLTIVADGEDAAIITVEAPKLGAASVTLLVADTPVPVTLTNGVGTVSVSSNDPASISIRVQDGNNRSLDVLVVEAQ